MEPQTMTLKEIKQQVASKHGFKNWGCVIHCVNGNKMNKAINEAAELYAEYKYLKGFQDGYDERNQHKS